MAKKTRRAIGDPFIMEVVQWFCMVILKHRITRGYDTDKDGKPTGPVKFLYWDAAENWSDAGDDWARNPGASYPKPFWTRKTS